MHSLGGRYDGGNDQTLRTFCWLTMSVIVLMIVMEIVLFVSMLVVIMRLLTFCWLIMSVIVVIMDRIHCSVVMMDCIHCSIGNDKISLILRTLYLVIMMFIDVVLMLDMM